MGKPKKKPGPDRAVVTKSEFVPSTGEEGYMQDKKLMLADLADGIKLDLNSAAGSMLAAGDKLRGARKLLPSDNAYGKWIKDNFPSMSRRWLTQIRSIADDAELRKMIEKGLHSFSAIAELLIAPPKVVKELADATKPATVKEVREKVKDAKEDGGRTSADRKDIDKEIAQEIAEDNAERVRAAIDSDDYEIEPPAPTLEEAWEEFLQSPVTDRIMHFIEQDRPMDTGWAFFIYGVASTFEDDAHAPNRDETELRYSNYRAVIEAIEPDDEFNRFDDIPALSEKLDEAKLCIHNFYVVVANERS